MKSSNRYQIHEYQNDVLNSPFKQKALPINNGVKGTHFTHAPQNVYIVFDIRKKKQLFC